MFIFQYIQYNVSHDGDFVCIGCALGQLYGLDIVDTRRVFDITELRDQLTASEWQRVQQAPDPNLEFFRFWALKESYIKAVGSGLSIEPSRLEFVFGSMTVANLPLPLFQTDCSAPSESSAFENGSPLAAPTTTTTSPASPAPASRHTIEVRLDGRRQDNWHFAPFAIDAHHIGCVARGPLTAAVDHYAWVTPTRPDAIDLSDAASVASAAESTWALCIADADTAVEPPHLVELNPIEWSSAPYHR